MIYGSNLFKFDNRPGLSVVTTGKLPKLLFVHGANCNKAIWWPLMKSLASEGIDSIALDLRGHGESQGRELLHTFTIFDYVSDVIEILNLSPTVSLVAGHSMGGLVSQLVAGQRDLSGLILIASSPVAGMRSEGFRMTLKHPVTFLAATLKRSYARLYQKEYVVRSLLFDTDSPQTMVQEFMRTVQEESWIAASQMVDVLPDPTKVSCKALVIGGKKDFMVSAKAVKRTAIAYRTEPVFFDRAAHMVPLEVKPKILARVIIDFLKSS